MTSRKLPRGGGQPAPPGEGPPRPRGRPPADPERGAATDAQRAAARRDRAELEVQQLVICLNLAVRELYRLGAATTLARLFQWQLSPALDLIRRACPALSEELLQMVETSAGLRDEFLARRKAPRPPAGRRRGSILVGGSEFRMDDAGTVLRDERPSSFRINRERSYHVLVDQEDPEFRLRRHYGASGRIMALLDAALLLVESDTTERMWSIRCPHGEEIPGFLPGSRYDPERGRKLDAEQQALDARKAARVRKP